MEKYIAGIFNYCDYWCERCAFTSKCGSFAMEEKLQKSENEGGRVVDKETFWEEIEKSSPSEDADDVSFDELRIDEIEESLLSDEFFDNENDELEKTSENFLFKAAQAYSDEARAWIMEYEKNIFDHAEGDTEKQASDCTGSFPFNSNRLQDAIEVAGRYAFFITAKLARAISGFSDEFEELTVDSDANGSAKIALITISRSINAWSIIRSICKNDDGRTAVLLGRLISIRRAAEQLFPHAMEFVRPGFDDV